MTTTNRRRRPGPKGGLSREAVVTAARAIAERGIAELTLTTLARELDVTPMTFYTYVSDKDHLVALVLDSVLSEIDVPGEDVGDWEARLRLFHTAICDALLRHPGLLFVSHEGYTLANSDRLLDGYLQILLDGGFDEATAARAYTGLFHLAMGVVTSSVRFEVASPVGQPRPAEFEAIARVQPIAVDFTRDAYIEFSLDTYLAGLRTMAPKRRRARR